MTKEERAVLRAARRFAEDLEYCPVKRLLKDEKPLVLAVRELIKSERPKTPKPRRKR